MSTGEAGDGGRSPEFVQSLERGLAVITAFSRERPSLTLADAARYTGLTRATCRRILITLGDLGYVRNDGRLFSLTPRVLDIGYAYLSSLDLSDVAAPYMEALSERVHESCSAAVLDGAEIVYVARVPTKRIMTISLGLGSRLPAATTSMGRVLLADLTPDRLDEFFASYRPPAVSTKRAVTDETRLREVLDDVRQQGWVLVDQELEQGLRSIAVPLRDKAGRAVAAMNISAHAGRVTLEQMRRSLLPELLETATAISVQLAKR